MAAQDDIPYLQDFFQDHRSSKEQFRKLILACEDLNPIVTVLALQGLYDIENNAKSNQFQQNEGDRSYIEDLLRKSQHIPILGSLTIFKTFDVDNNDEKNEPSSTVNTEPESFAQCQSLILDSFYINDIDPIVAVLALQGLYANVESNLLDDYMELEVKQLLWNWRNESLFDYGREPAYIRQRSIPILRSLTIFKAFDVPLFIDNYGKKELFSNDPNGTEEITIGKDTPIYHVTHKAEADQICKQKYLKPSDNKNIIEGCWFGIKGEGPSIYGSMAFKTTLGKLGVQVLRQGEIVSYKREVNVILYAGNADKASNTGIVGTNYYTGLKKPIVNDDKHHVEISIFVPSDFLPCPDKFFTVFDQPFEVINHCKTFCLRQKRKLRKSMCQDQLDQLEEYFATLNVND